MAIKLIDTVKPKGNFPIAEAEDIGLSDGTRLDAELEEIKDAIPAKTSQLENDSGYVKNAAFSAVLATKEDVSNKLQTYNGTDGSWSEATSTKYPSAAAVRDFVVSYVGANPGEYSDPLDLYTLIIHPEMNIVETEELTWDGNTAGLTSFLDMFYKISDGTEFPDTFKIEISENTGGTVSVTDSVFPGLSLITLNGKMTDLKDSRGIVVYTFDSGSGPQPFAVVANRSGMLPPAAAEQISGMNPGTHVPYTAGTYVRYTPGSSSSKFVSKAVKCMSVKNYIDKRLEETGGGA